jgi:DnaK suppressor protein
MFVSILQLMGFPLAKPVHSRASDVQRGGVKNFGREGVKLVSLNSTQTSKSGSSGVADAQADSARRQEVKAKTGKVKVVNKNAKSAGKTPAKVKPAVKVLAKTKGKPVVKPKPVAKTVSKAITKPVSKKPAAKKAAPAKSAKPSVKVLIKASAKKVVAVKVPKPAAKVVPKAPKPAPVKVAKAAVKVKAKDSVKATIAKVSSAPVAVPKDKPVLAPAAAGSAPVPARAGRPSSRLAQLTVPSMAQSVASTAAKASFTQTVSSPLIVPPLASAIKKDPKLANNWKLKPVEQLTDAEVIAMPDDEYMNETQFAFFRRKLIQLKKDILSNAGETTEHLREDTVVVPDPADRATIEEEHALELRTRDRERKLLKKIEQSIARIDSGDYGYCDETGEPIGVGRLLARPTANLSLEAQQRRELKQKMFGD